MFIGDSPEQTKVKQDPEPQLNRGWMNLFAQLDFRLGLNAYSMVSCINHLHAADFES